MGICIIPTEMRKNPGGLLPYVSYLRMCHPKEYDVLSGFGLKRISILLIMVRNRVWFSREQRGSVCPFNTLNEESSVSDSTR